MPVDFPDLAVSDLPLSASGSDDAVLVPLDPELGVSPPPPAPPLGLSLGVSLSLSLDESSSSATAATDC